MPALRAQWLHVLEEGYTSIAEVQADLGTGPGRYELRAERVQDGLLLTIRDLDEPGRRGPEEEARNGWRASAGSRGCSRTRCAIRSRTSTWRWSSCRRRSPPMPRKAPGPIPPS